MEYAFEKIKTSMTKVPVLALPYFEKLFVVESNVSQVGIGGVLSQKDCPITFFSN